MKFRLILFLRLALGAVFLYAAYTKLRQPWQVFAISIDSYQLLPPWAVFTVARWLPWMELTLGALLVVGRFLKYAAPMLSVLLIFFYAAMWHAYGSGIDCGCFGIGEAISAATLVRDGLLLGCSVLLSGLVLQGMLANRKVMNDCAPLARLDESPGR
jgi:uncharacterized membrane protein YphA (DoxX/SURF4 family)